MKHSIASLITALCFCSLLLLWGCDAENLPTAVVSTPIAQATIAASPTAEQATATPEPEQPTATSTASVPTPEPTLPPTLTLPPTQEPTETATEAPPTDTPARVEDTPTRAAPTATRIRLTRTPAPTREANSDTTPGLATPTQLVAKPTVSSEGPPTGAWSQVVRVAPGNKHVALTFDAGASGETCPMVLSTLRERGIHITMFFTGKFAEQYPDCITQALADGNELANHTYSHLDSRTLTDQQLTDELARTEQIIQNLTGGATTKPYWRPPFGAYNNHVLQVAAAQGYRSIYWTLDSLDSVGQPKTPDFIYNRVTNPPGGLNLDGAIVLQHFGSEASAEALPRELDRLKELGYQVVTISDLLSP